MAKTDAEKLKEELCYDAEHAMKSQMSDAEVDKADKFCDGYIDFLNEAKTEREIVIYFKNKAEALGFEEFDKTKKYKAGDKVYKVQREKAIILAVIGKKPITEGVKLAVAHIDSPRLDLKPNPLYESEEIALFKTHYYGGIKKYQWVTIPLSLHGVVVKPDGKKIVVNIGEDDNDPKFVITDLLPHLGKEQEKRTLADGIRGEELNVLVGSRPFKDDKDSNLVKLNILKLLNEKYGIVEKDFLSAELEIVPAFKACDIGLDRSMIGAYGHDDRVCAYPAAKAAFDIKDPAYTVVTVLTDKEEIGSYGNTGLTSAYLPYFLSDLAECFGAEGRDVMSKSECLSADVNSAFDPTFPEVMEKRNVSYINKGVVITKYTGARGKSGSSDASAEFMGKVRGYLEANNIVWQIGELGAVDAGGGGTVALDVASHDIDVVDLGVPVLSMHAPFEVVAKIDVYSAFRAFYEFFNLK
ncbi:MAG: aminopeptidase [Oscillospiraceae bacterium]|nr:aminopeptidase [Candidatus Limimonas coprohippi]MCQ2488184.1 aminopeptidase [Clostridia bacterium]